MYPNVKRKYKFAVIATDIVIFTVQDEKLQVLLIKMKKKPFTDYWAAPGGLVKPIEAVDASARRILLEKTGVKDVYLEQLHAFGRVDRDPFGRVVSVAYFALIPNAGLKLKTTKDYAEVTWFPVKKLPKLAYDHAEIIDYAINRLKDKLEHSNIVYSLLPQEFTLSELQRIYEIILGKKIDKRNFRKKFFSLRLVKNSGKKRRGEANRPAELYSFIKRSPQVVKIL